jgi:hypothetical protein
MQSLAALMTTHACVSAIGKRRGGDRGARGTVVRLVAQVVKNLGKLGEDNAPPRKKAGRPAEANWAS